MPTRAANVFLPCKCLTKVYHNHYFYSNKNVITIMNHQRLDIYKEGVLCFVYVCLGFGFKPVVLKDALFSQKLLPKVCLGDQGLLDIQTGLASFNPIK